jgi:hypothetical protein
VLYHWRTALILGAVFVATGIVYLVLQTAEGFDYAGVVMLIAVGIAMAFAFAILLRGSGEL